MGLFDSIKTEAQRNFIARPPDQANSIVFKWPDTNVRMMTQLTVGGDEVALFVKNRNVVGVLPPKPDGSYSLDTHNVPFISKLLEGVTGGNLFMAELFFVLTREIPNLRFGTPVGMMQDPKLKIAVTPLVHGEFSVRVTDRPSWWSASRGSRRAARTTSSSTGSPSSSRRSCARSWRAWSSSST